MKAKKATTRQMARASGEAAELVARALATMPAYESEDWHLMRRQLGDAIVRLLKDASHGTDD